MSTPNPSVPRLEPLDISVVVPVHNESGAVAGLVQEIAAALDGWAYEMIFVDDASKDDTHAKLVALKATYPALRVLANRKNAGQSRAIMNGVLAARAPVIGTLDGDGQNDPADLPALLQQLNRPDAPQGLGFVGGRRVKRQDSQAKKLASRLANNVRQALLRDGADDSGCGIKVVRRDLFLRLPYFDHMHRHRSTGASKYTNLGRLLAALTDLGGVIWLRTRRRDFGHVDET
jgi:glycosyltransferase involved in cell wall biosynthesis